MRIRAVSIVALLALGACANDGGSFGGFDGDNPLAPASPEEIEQAVAAFHPGADADHADRSAFDALTTKRQSELDGTTGVLAALLPSPDAFGEFRLANLQVDDPNGDGRFGDYWYPPRVLRQECSAKVDLAPGPFAVAQYVPGSGQLGDVNPMSSFDLMSSAVGVGVQVQLFDDASQRDASLAASLEFYRDPSFMCGGGRTTIQTYIESELTTPLATAIVIEAESSFLGGGVSGLVTVGDRVLLVVSVTSDAVDAPWSADDLKRWLAPVIDVALERLDVAELP